MIDSYHRVTGWMLQSYCMYIYKYILKVKNRAMFLHDGRAVLCRSADVFSTGIWEDLEEFTDPELKRLAKAIPDAVLSSRASSTTTKYLGAFK